MGELLMLNVQLTEGEKKKVIKRRKLRNKTTIVAKSNKPNLPKLQNVVYTYINFKGMYSKKTKVEYEADIRQFFRILKNKEIGYEIESLNESDLHIDIMDIMEYVLTLQKDYELANSSINRKITSIRGLYKKLEASYSNSMIRASAFNIGTLKHEADSYDSISLEEADKMTELALSYSKPKARITKYEEQYWFLKLASRTSYRLQALLSLTWDDVKNAKKIDDLYILSVVDKGNKIDHKPLVDNVYHDLLELKNVEYYKRYSDNKVFHFRPNDIGDMIKELCEKMEFPESRKVVFHSFRKCGGNYVMKLTGNVYLAKEQLNHDSVVTYEKSYHKENKNFDFMAGALMDRKTDPNLVPNLSEEQMRNIIANAPKEFQIQFELLAKRGVSK